ncbi:MAG: hypothetical protein ABW171_00595 [Steroidobacter sp.]
MKTFFAHQSVGADILAGVDELVRRGSYVAQVLDLAQLRGGLESHSTDVLRKGGHIIVHERMGINREPLTKITAFRDLLTAKHRPEIDLALLKFCYVDIATQAEAEQLWRHYETAIEQLSTVLPSIRLVHCTVPLRSLPEGPYAWLRRALGHRHPTIVGNRARDWFNRQLREHFGAGRELFDLAALQSQRADGKVCELNDNGARVPSLAREWTYDGGHFNERGRTMAAAAFLEFLQTLQDSSKR